MGKSGLKVSLLGYGNATFDDDVTEEGVKRVTECVKM